MGVPKLFQFLQRHYAKIIQKTKTSAIKAKILALDFNSLMHPVCASIASVNSEINYKRKQNWPTLFRAILEEFKKVVKETNCCFEEIYISIDGVVPMAKIIQQRQRRFRSAFERFGKKTNWDSCLISPGTFFMNQFEIFLEKNIKEINSIKGLDKCKIIINNSKQFGEGEQKIMKYIREKTKNKCILIYGLDADLILLSILLLKTHSEIYLLRENVYCSLSEFEKDDYLLVNIKILWKLLVNEINNTISKHQIFLKKKGVEPTIFNINENSLMNDFILLSCYFGNDFLPAIPAVSLSLQDSIYFIIDNYSKTLAEEGNYMVQHVTDNVFRWNSSFLIKFWSLCRVDENKRMSMRTNHWLRKRLNEENTKESIQPIKELHSIPQKKQNWIRYSLSNYNRYLDVFSSDHKFFNFNSSETQSQMVLEWLRGSIWVLSYYSGFKVDPFWWYVWEAPPSFHHLLFYHSEHLKNTTQVMIIPIFLNQNKRKKLSRPNLYLQHLCIIPPDSEYCVPTKKMGWNNPNHPRNLYTPKYHQIKKMNYSITWATYSHECPVQLPLLNLPKITQYLIF